MLFRTKNSARLYVSKSVNFPGHFEHPPYSDDTIRSAYHTRSIDTFRFKQVKLPIDIMISHDWPQGIYNYGDVDTLVRKKQHFKEQVEPGTRTPLGRFANLKEFGS